MRNELGMIITLALIVGLAPEFAAAQTAGASGPLGAIDTKHRSHLPRRTRTVQASSPTMRRIRQQVPANRATSSAQGCAQRSDRAD